MPLSKPSAATARLATGILAVCLFVSCTTQPRRAVPLSDRPFRQIVIGLCEDYPEESRSIEAARADLELLKTNNIPVLRVAFGWDAIEPAQGRYDWSFWDEFVRTAVDDYGITLIPYICYTPKWAATDPGANSWRAPPRNNEDFARFVAAIVNRYKDRIHSWELWNEPDNPAYWTGTAEQFAALIKAGSQGVRAADPTAKVVSGGIAWNLDFLNQQFEDLAVGPYVDVVNLHNYYETWAGESLEEIGDYITTASRIIAEHGNNQPLWLAEVGYSDFRRDGFVSKVYTAQVDYEHTREFQAVSIGRALTAALATEKVSLFAWYRIHDLPHTENIIGDVNNRHLGVLDVDNAPKPALAALTFFRDLFAGGVRCVDEQVQATRRLRSRSEIHAFEKGTGEIVVVAWLKVTSPSMQSQEEIQLKLPVNVPSRATVYNATGARAGTLPVRRDRDSSVIYGLTLHPGQMSIIIVQAATKSPRKSEVMSFAE